MERFILTPHELAQIETLKAFVRPMKHPPKQMTDPQAKVACEEFVIGN